MKATNRLWASRDRELRRRREESYLWKGGTFGDFQIRCLKIMMEIRGVETAVVERKKTPDLVYPDF